MNWKLRLKNKTTLVTLTVAVITCIYSILSAFDVAISLTKDTATSIALAIISALCALGIVVDPTTSGVTDSEKAKTYDDLAN